MKQKKTFKSLTELSVDSLRAVDAEPEKANPPEAQVPAEKRRGIRLDSFPRVPDIRGYHCWGINE